MINDDRKLGWDTLLFIGIVAFIVLAFIWGYSGLYAELQECKAENVRLWDCAPPSQLIEACDGSNAPNCYFDEEPSPAPHPEPVEAEGLSVRGFVEQENPIMAFVDANGWLMVSDYDGGLIDSGFRCVQEPEPVERECVECVYSAYAPGALLPYGGHYVDCNTVPRNNDKVRCNCWSDEPCAGEIE